MRLQQVRLLTASPGLLSWQMLSPAWPRWTREYFLVEIFEIYCKIQNRLIFIMRIKTFFFLHLEEKKKIEMREPQLPRHQRRGKGGKPRGIGTAMGTKHIPREPTASLNLNLPRAQAPEPSSESLRSKGTKHMCE